MSDGEYFSNAGSLGIELRQDNRLYMNAEEFFRNGRQTEEAFAFLAESAEQYSDVTRIVMRGIAGTKAFEDFCGGRYGANVEAAVGLSQHGHEGVLFYAGNNLPNRDETIVPMPEMTLATQESQHANEQASLSDIWLPNAEEVYVSGNIDATDISQLHELWGQIFGWSQDEIAAFARRIGHNSQQLWFAGVFDDSDQLLSAAMGERIDLIGRNGNITLVENTEWATRPNGYRGRGYMSMAVSSIGAQALRRLEGSPNGPPVIYAECSFQSRSDRVAQRAGYRIPGLHIARQILPQHVTVNDGLEPVGLRDFTFLTLPDASIRDLYAREQIAEINERLRWRQS